ncbi:MAG: hypothetical protein GAK31_00375 [Stenotrophomonas maltophilia]|uniref:Uncharacterized protein n=1 Tax=Stenotrophomonas maltophilia TaxID=40324 RepID=A0A7V8FJC6_STEMA|nr:MAG: hypothetical protein GAK31_00375 [Stenotrophomonas maltophilia]
MALGLAALVAARLQWPPPAPEPLAFQSIADDRYAQLRRRAIQFVQARQRQGFLFVERHEDVTFHIRCRGVPVLWLERRPQYLLLQASLDARQRAPAVLQLRGLLQRQLEPVAPLEQLLAGVPEPVLLDRVLQRLAGEVPASARCGTP